MSYKNTKLLMFASVLLLSACDDPYEPTLHADYAIRVAPVVDTNNRQTGSVAIAPACASWNDDLINPFDNQPYPQFGCSTSRNLAEMIERPEDLTGGRPLAGMRGVMAVGAIRRYDNNQTRGLVLPGADTSSTAVSSASVSASSMTGDMTAASAAAAPASSGGSSQ